MSERYPGGFITKNAPTLDPALGSAAPGIWTRDQVMQAIKAATWPPYDPYYKYVTLNLHGNGTNGAQNNTFLDSSTNNFTITRNGNTTQGTFTPYGSNWSNYFDAASYLYGPASSASAVDFAGAYTLEGWFYLNTTPASGTGLAAASDTIISTSTGSGNNWKRWLFDGSTSFSFINRSGASYVTITMSSSTPINQWFHCAFVMDASTTATVYINGVSVGTATDSTTFSARTTYQVVIGDGTLGGNYGYFNGYMSNLRFSNTARYTATFTPSTVPLTADASTTLLTCQSNRFVDNSSSAVALTIGGSGIPSVQRFSPFNISTAYSTSVIGGSGYFDGSGDYLGVASNAGFTFGTSTDFTIEMWVNTSSTANMCLIDARPSGTAVPWALYTTATTGFPYFYDGTSYTSSVALTLNAWNHVAVSRSAGTLKIFVNGVQGYSAANTSNLTSGALQIGGAFSGAYFTGYISDIRIVNGTGIYTAAFTPPTAPLTAVTNTKLLLNYTNAGIYDNAEMNDLETVSSAQISTSVVKFGIGSMSFNGSSSYLQGPVNPSYAFSTGNFTIEFWVYVTSYTATATTVVRTAGTSGWVCQFNGSNYMVFYANGVAQLTDSASPSTGTWTYFAVVRSGSTLTMYRNGTSVASTTYATAINPTGVLLVGCGGDSNNASYGLNGYIDDLRITKGYARYTANFTVQTSQWQDQ